MIFSRTLAQEMKRVLTFHRLHRLRRVFLGHKGDTYHDIESLGMEKLRSIYANANLAIRPRSTVAKLALIREFARGNGRRPGKDPD